MARAWQPMSRRQTTTLTVKAPSPKKAERFWQIRASGGTANQEDHSIHEHQTVALTSHVLELHPNFTLPPSHLIVHIIAIHVYNVGTFGASGLPITVHIEVKLLPYGTFMYLLLPTFLDSRIILLIQYGQSAASVST